MAHWRRVEMIWRLYDCQDVEVPIGGFRVANSKHMEDLERIKSLSYVCVDLGFLVYFGTNGYYCAGKRLTLFYTPMFRLLLQRCCLDFWKTSKVKSQPRWENAFLWNFGKLTRVDVLRQEGNCLVLSVGFGFLRMITLSLFVWHQQDECVEWL